MHADVSMAAVLLEGWKQVLAPRMSSTTCPGSMSMLSSWTCVKGRERMLSDVTMVHACIEWTADSLAHQLLC